MNAVAENGNTDMVKLLIKFGADVNQEEKVNKCMHN